MRVLHVPYTYAPDPVGGTEVYVSSLASKQTQLGLDAIVAAPGTKASKVRIDGTDVYRFAMSNGPGSAEGIPDWKAADEFAKILDALQPDVVHLHARTAAVSVLLLEAAKARGAATVFTYHTPTVSCAQGTMMLREQTPCDGRLDVKRCSACVLQKHGVPYPLATGLAHVPPAVGRAARRIGLRQGPWLAVRMPQIIEDSHRHFQSLMAAADRVVAVCDWVADVLRRNGIQEPKLLVNRQGVALDHIAETPISPRKGESLRVAYFGRLDPSKGTTVLIEALRLSPALPVSLSLYGIPQPGRYAQILERARNSDPRIFFREPVPASQVTHQMTKYDLIAVPSLGLETGPLVVLEAFAAGVPVLGSRLGGIAELIRHGIDGFLVEPNDPAAWGSALEAFAEDRSRLSVLRSAIRPPRSIMDVAADMILVYETLDGERRTGD